MNVEGEKECMPLEILPEKLSINDYDIRYDKNDDKITEVRHRLLGAVKFS